MTIGQTIKLYRKEKGFTQGQLAELIGVSTQAISKWETDTGMPDISQIVPLAKVLQVSTDKLLGHTDEDFERELEHIKSYHGGINLISDAEKAGNLYEMSLKFFNKYPDVPDIALNCLECYVELFAKRQLNVQDKVFLEECERYSNSIFRYENNPDNICKTYYLMARAHDLCGETGKSESLMQNLPYIYGDREYWEAEMAYADGKYDIALEKIKRSFALKARFAARSIRLAARITKARGESDAAEKCVALNEYMLRVIDAFLSGGDYLPHRQIYQKTSLLSGLVVEHVKRGNKEKALIHMQDLYDTREMYFEFLDHPENKHCLMFVEGDMDRYRDTTRDEINERVARAEEAIKGVV
ncbi:MAG: helix-turn-helix transcriptional regulator [Lachnospiraceae bacterium]|nr:helix-turn-helix transcriptional regulator [Lachnospiraceae bacterium]